MDRVRGPKDLQILPKSFILNWKVNYIKHQLQDILVCEELALSREIICRSETECFIDKTLKLN